MRLDEPLGAWVIVPPAACGSHEADRRTLAALLTDGLDPQHRPAEIHPLACPDAGTVHEAFVYRILSEGLRSARAPRLVWIVADTEEALGDRFLRTEAARPRLTLHNLWRCLIAAARASERHPLVAFVDVCHAAPPPELRAPLPPNLVVFASSATDEKARADANGSWFTQKVARLLTEGPACEVTAGDLAHWLKQARPVDQMPFVHLGDHWTLVLNRRAGVAASGADPVTRYRAWAAHVHAHLVDLFENALTEEVYVELELGLEVGLGGRSDLPARPRLADLMAAPGARWAVLGEPGAGKSTIARHLACQTAQNPDGPLPIYVPLAAFARSEADAFDCIEAEVRARRLPACPDAAGIADALRDAAAVGNAWLLLDGLDEVGRDHLDAVRQRIADLARDWPDLPVAVLSRPVGFDDLPGFGRVRVRPLDDEGQQRLLAKWLKDPARAMAAWRKVDASHALHVIAGYPLMLTLIALAWRADEDLPPTRVALYGRALDLLMLRRHAPDRRAARLTVDQAEAARVVLRHLSLTLQRVGEERWPPHDLARHLGALEAGDPPPEPFRSLHGRGLGPPLQEARRTVSPTPRTFLRAVAEQTGILAAHDGDGAPWRYLHRSLRDALSAELLAEAGGGAVEGLARKLSREDTGRWAETFALAADRLGDPARLVRAVLEIAPDLARQMVIEVDGLAPAEAVELLWGCPDWTGDDLRSVAERWGTTPAGQAALWERVRPGTATAELAALHYALSATTPVNDAAFFRAAGRPQASLDLRWVELEGGTFLMGSPEHIGHDDERPQRLVTLTAFAMSATLVTRAQFAAFEPAYECAGRGDHPVTDVTWFLARLYAHWAHAALPTEAQWEYACRAGTTTRWSHGDDEAGLDEYAWYDLNTSGEIQPVAQKAPNPWGLYDLHGNVWEWCRNGFEDCPRGPAADPTGPTRGQHRAIRGGCYWTTADRVRSAYRFDWPPNMPGEVLGFRLVRPAPRTRPSTVDA